MLALLLNRCDRDQRNEISPSAVHTSTRSIAVPATSWSRSTSSVSSSSGSTASVKLLNARSRSSWRYEASISGALAQAWWNPARQVRLVRVVSAEAAVVHALEQTAQALEVALAARSASVVGPGAGSSGAPAYVILIYVRRTMQEAAVEDAKARLLEAEQEYQRARADDYVTRLIRDAAMVEAHRSGLSSREISDLLGGIGQPNVVRARRRASSRIETLPEGLLSPADAVRVSGLSPKEFVMAVRERRIASVEPLAGVHAFRSEDVRRIAGASST